MRLDSRKFDVTRPMRRRVVPLRDQQAADRVADDAPATETPPRRPAFDVGALLDDLRDRAFREIDFHGLVQGRRLVGTTPARRGRSYTVSVVADTEPKRALAGTGYQVRVFDGDVEACAPVAVRADPDATWDALRPAIEAALARPG